MALHSIKIESKDALRGLDRLRRQQLPFAMSRALTEVARQSQAAVRRDVQHTFHNTTPWYNPGSPIGIKVQVATKQNLQSAVTSRAYFGPLQVRGGTKTPQHGSHIAIPSPVVKARRSRWAGGARAALDDRKRTFLVRSGSRAFIFQRKGKGKNSQLVLLYTLVPRAQISPEWKIIEVAKKVYTRRFRKILKNALSQAIANKLS